MYKPQVIIEKPMWQLQQRCPTRKATGHRFLFPPNPNIYSTETDRRREVLATTWQVGRGRTEGRGRGQPPAPVLQGMAEEEARAQSTSRTGLKGPSSSLLVLLTACPEFSARGVQCVTGREKLGGHSHLPRTSVVQCGPGAPTAMSSVCPTSAPPLPQRWLEVVRASWVGDRGR